VIDDGRKRKDYIACLLAPYCVPILQRVRGVGINEAVADWVFEHNLPLRPTPSLDEIINQFKRPDMTGLRHLLKQPTISAQLEKGVKPAYVRVASQNMLVASLMNNDPALVEEAFAFVRRYGNKARDVPLLRPASFVWPLRVLREPSNFTAFGVLLGHADMTDSSGK